MLRKLWLFIMVVMLSAALAGAAQAKTLVVYFSMPETDKAENMTEAEEDSTIVVGGKVLGNVQYFAQVIQNATGADIFRIEPKTPYTTNHRELVDLARLEQRRNARPELKSSVDGLGQYDTVFLGYPTWWADLPMVLYTFLETNDLSGKTVIPFNVHGGSGFAGTPRTIAKIQPNAKVLRNGLSIDRDRMDGSEVAILRWLRELGYAK
ncbi:MAG: flavodoxin [Synergistaceae bacterium]|nr:flavodoxin [Synergistaceae bacterium]